MSRLAENLLGVRFVPAAPPAGLRGLLLKLTGTSDTGKPDPSAYSAVDTTGYVVPCQQEAYFLALRYVRAGDRVLDVGFGLGYGLTILAIQADAVHGVDVDARAIEHGRQAYLGRNPRLAEVRQYGGERLDYPDGFFDVVTCIDVIEHVKDHHGLLAEMMRVSKRGVFVSTPNRRPEYTNADGTPRNPWHLREWSHEEFDAMVRRHGTPEWNVINGPFEGPFTVTQVLQADTLALSPFVRRPLTPGGP